MPGTILPPPDSSRYQPLGVLMRSRRDWSVERLMGGGGGVNGGPGFAYVGLYNDGNIGDYIAVYGISLHCEYTPSVSVGAYKGLDPSANNRPGVPLKLDAPTDHGITSTNAGGPPNFIAGALGISAGAASVNILEESPLFLIPAGQMLAISFVLGANISYVNYIWAKY